MQLLIADLLGVIRSHLQLLILLLEALVKLRQFGFDVIFDITLLVPDNLNDLVLKAVF